MIISPAQLKAINEASIDGGTFTDSGNLTNQINREMGNSAKQPFRFTNANPNAKGAPLSIQQGEDITNNTKISDAQSVNVLPDNNNNNVYESRYSKRQVELGRMLEMRKHGKIYSKKQLNEMFAGGAEIPSAEEIIKRTSVFKIFDAVLIAFGEEVKAEMDEMFESGEDMTQWIMNLLNEATPEQKNEFFSEIMR